MSTGTDFFQSKMLAPTDAVEGQSGYFSTATPDLDPHLFNHGTDVFSKPVREWILNTLYQHWGSKYNQPRTWSTVWVAGSGISHQWSAARGNGDLDILIGVDFPLFFRSNDRYLGLSEDDMAAIINEELHDNLWPSTFDVEFSSTDPNGLKQAYEVTFYVNARATDIREIHPYAAYNLTTDEWTVRPPTIAETTHADVPREYWDAIEDERHLADALVSRYDHHASILKSQPVNSPGWHNTSRQVEVVVAQASALYEDIHLGRRQAFGPGGSGYGDYYNFRWQAHKQAGTAEALNSISHDHADAKNLADEQTYGHPLDAASVSLRRAALWNRGGNGR